MGKCHNHEEKRPRRIENQLTDLGRAARADILISVAIDDDATQHEQHEHDYDENEAGGVHKSELRQNCADTFLV